jgi:hypothetical protein
MKISKERLKQIIKEEIEVVTNEGYDIGPMGAVEPHNDLPSVAPEEIDVDASMPEFEQAVANLSQKYPSLGEEMIRAMVADMFAMIGAEGY